MKNKMAVTPCIKILLIDHGRCSLEVISDLRENHACFIFYVGQDTKIQLHCDAFLNLNVVRDKAELFQNHMEYIRDFRFSIVYTFSEHGLGVRNEIADALKLPVNSAAVSIFRDKFQFRNHLKRHGLPSVEHCFYSADESLINFNLTMRFPLIVKPNAGYASAGVQLVTSEKELSQAFRNITLLNRIMLSRTIDSECGVLLEEYLPGEEISVDAISLNGITRIAGICEKTFVNEANFQDHGYFISPERFNLLKEETEPIVANMLVSLNYRNGPSHTELRRAGDGSWRILESAPRVGGGGSIGTAIEVATSHPYNWIALSAARSTFAEDEFLSLDFTPKCYSAFFVPDGGRGGKIAKILGKDFLSRDSRIKHFQFLKEEGENLVPYPRGSDYPGIIIFSANDPTEFEQVLALIKEKVEVRYD